MRYSGATKNAKGFPQQPIWDPVEDKYQDGAQTLVVNPDGFVYPSGSYHGADKTADVFLSPPLESMMVSIMIEIAEERMAGLVRPFREGEPIGKYQKRKPRKPEKENPAKRFERRQEDLLHLRVRNNAAIRRILEG